MSNILYIEDDEDNAFMLELWLKKKGYEVTIAVSAEDGFDCLANNKPDLIIMDVSLPKMSGLEATEILKQEDSTCDIPIIILTTHAMLGDKELGLNSGADGYETKPVDFPKLHEQIQGLLKNE